MPMSAEHTMIEHFSKWKGRAYRAFKLRSSNAATMSINCAESNNFQPEMLQAVGESI